MKFLRLFFLIILILWINVGIASAYLDPGFASMVWQVTIASVLGLIYAIKIYWTQIRKKIQEKIHEMK